MTRICEFKCLKMDKRVAVQACTNTSDGQGGNSEVWATFASVWAEIKPIKGYLKFQAAQNQVPITHQIVIRYRSDITARHRLLFGERVFNIKEIINIEEANAFFKITAIEMA